VDLDGNGVFDLRDVIILFTAISVVIGAVVIVTKQIVKPVNAWLQRQFREAVSDTVAPALERIEGEVTANGGGSLKDLVKRNHTETLGIFQARDATFAELARPWTARVEALEQGQSKILSRLDTIDANAATNQADVISKLDEKTDNQKGTS
jgi:hypothetical protein